MMEAYESKLCFVTACSELEELSLDHITPIEALNFLAEVKHLLQSNAKDTIL